MVQLKVKQIVLDECPYKGCSFNIQGMCCSETSLVKTSFLSVDTDTIDTTIECTNYALRALNICFRCGNPVNINPQYDMYGEIDKDCPHCNYRLW